MDIKINKKLHLSIESQIEGFIEFGIMSGYFYQEPRLPSIRELSNRLSVSQATVSKAYENLKDKSLIYSVPGKGLFAINGTTESKRLSEINQLKDEFNQLIEKSRRQNIDPMFFIHLLDNRQERQELVLNKKIAWVGNSRRVNNFYIKELNTYISIKGQVDNFNFQQFENLTTPEKQQYSMVLTIPHCVPKVKEQLEKIPVLAPYLVPSPKVINKLLNLNDKTKLLVVSKFPNFIPIMLEGIIQYFKNENNITVVDVLEMEKVMADKHFDVLVYSSGCHFEINNLKSLTILTFEYEHIPEHDYLLGVVIPMLHNIAEEEKC